MNANVPLVADPVAHIEETTATWGAVTDAESEIETDFFGTKPATGGADGTNVATTTSGAGDAAPTTAGLATVPQNTTADDGGLL